MEPAAGYGFKYLIYNSLIGVVGVGAPGFDVSNAGALDLQ
jgi:hypothetical protein